MLLLCWLICSAEMRAPVAQALILAAGRGSRMMPLTGNRPKCLVKLNGKPLLQYSVQALLRHGISKITVVTGYRGGMIRAFLGACFPNIEFGYVVNHDWHNTNSLASLQFGLSALGSFKPYLLLEADIVYDHTLLQRLLAAEDDMATLLHPYQDGLSGTFARVENGFVLEWIHETRRHAGFPLRHSYKTVNISCIRCSQVHQKMLQAVQDSLLEDGRHAPLEYAMQKLLAADVMIRAVETAGMNWAELDTPEELSVFHDTLQAVCAEA